MNIEYLKSSKANNFFLLAGPCVIEGEEMALDIAEKMVKITSRLDIPYVFKGSYRKANRSRIDSFTGIGDEKALKVLKKVRDTFGIPVVTDIHAAEEAAMAAEYVDILQIPAFLCRPCHSSLHCTPYHFLCVGSKVLVNEVTVCVSNCTMHICCKTVSICNHNQKSSAFCIISAFSRAFSLSRK